MAQSQFQENAPKFVVLSPGEVVFDCYQDGLRLGGSPLNMAYYVKQLGHEAIVASRVGSDELGRNDLSSK